MTKPDRAERIRTFFVDLLYLRRFASALHRECPADQVVGLAESSTWTDEAAAALAPNTPSSTLEALGHHAHEVVRALVRARRPRT